MRALVGGLVCVCVCGGGKKISVFVSLELTSIVGILLSSGIRVASASSDALFMRFRRTSLDSTDSVQFLASALHAAKPHVSR